METKTYEISNNYNSSIRNSSETVTIHRLIREFACYYENKEVLAGTKIELVKLNHPDGNGRNKDVLNVLDGMGYRSVTIYELVALMTEFKKELDDIEIIAPGAFLHNGGYEFVPRAKWRLIDFHWTIDSYWTNDCYFAVIKKERGE